MYKLSCIHCKNEFSVLYACKKTQKFCSTSCKKQHQNGSKQVRKRVRNTNICVTCGNKYFVKPSLKNKRTHCSIVCCRRDPDWSKKMSNVKTGQGHSVETRLQIKEKLIQIYSDPIKRRTLHAGRSQQPNKIESEFLEFLEQKFPGEFEYVGDGKLIVGRFCPDYVRKDDKFLIELYGNHWHAGQNPQDRIDYFAEYGYRTMVLWEKQVRQILNGKEEIPLVWQ